MNAPELTIALRALTTRYEEEDEELRPGKKRRILRWPKYVLVLDTETSVDAVQRLLFGCYRFYRWNDNEELECLEEGLFYGDDLPETDPAGFARLERYVKRHTANVHGSADSETPLRLYSRREFLKHVMYWGAYVSRAIIVGFNLPFDLSRLASDVGDARNHPNRGGFSFSLWEYRDKATGVYRPNQFFPRLVIKHIDSLRAFISFGKPAKHHPGDSESEKRKRSFRGRFLDLRTFTFALTNERHTLRSACETFGTRIGKGEPERHGHITARYIDYCRRDVAVTAALLIKTRAEFDKHPITLNPCKAFSPASLAKAYMRAMGIVPAKDKFASVPQEVIAMAMMAYFGGRAEARIRLIPAPVVPVDFFSMYPTVNALLGTFDLVVGEELEVVDATEDVRVFLASVTPEQCFDPSCWKELLFFALIRPQGADVLPVRAQYDPPNPTFNIAVNHPVSATALPYAGPDLVQSVLLSGQVPDVVRAYRLIPRGRQKGLKAVRLRNTVPVDPIRDDFYQKVIEERRRVKVKDPSLAAFLKNLANAGGYGVNAELNREDASADEANDIAVIGLEGEFQAHANAFEAPGAFCFPPLAALITAGARLMLGLLEWCVTSVGGQYAACDTDAMLIVSTEHGGVIPCPGGPLRTNRGEPAVRALSWAQVDAIITRFATLNPYDRSEVSGSILELEKENYDNNGERLHLFAVVIAAKRYALFDLTDSRNVVIRKRMEHGLGHLLNPGDPEDESKEWMTRVWQMIVGDVMGRPVAPPEWLSRPAASRFSITCPLFHNPFIKTWGHLPYAERPKPFNFILCAQLARPSALAHRSQPLRLISPYTTNPREWTKQYWTDIHTGEQFGITTGLYGSARILPVQSYGDVLREYRTHPEPKSADINGNHCGPETVGLLQRRVVPVGAILYCGKEGNRLEERNRGLVVELDDVQDMYIDRRTDLWSRYVIPFLQTAPRRCVAEACNVRRETAWSWQTDRSRPPRPRLIRVLSVLVDLAHTLITDPEANPDAVKVAQRLVQSPLMDLFPPQQSLQTAQQEEGTRNEA